MDYIPVFPEKPLSVPLEESSRPFTDRPVYVIPVYTKDGQFFKKISNEYIPFESLSALIDDLRQQFAITFIEGCNIRYQVEFPAPTKDGYQQVSLEDSQKIIEAFK